MKISEGHYPSDTSLVVKTKPWNETDLVECWCERYAKDYYTEKHGNYYYVHIWFKNASDKTLFVLRFGS